MEAAQHLFRNDNCPDGGENNACIGDDIQQQIE